MTMNAFDLSSWLVIICTPLFLVVLFLIYTSHYRTTLIEAKTESRRQKRIEDELIGKTNADIAEMKAEMDKMKKEVEAIRRLCEKLQQNEQG